MPSLKQTSLKPQDIVVCLGKHLAGRSESIQALSQALHISAGEVHGALKRAANSRLLIAEERSYKLAPAAFMEFVVFGLKYAFPASTGPLTRGTPTGIAAIPKYDRQFAPTDALPYVWPHAEGRMTGIGLAPLFPSVPQAAATNLQLYTTLALIDAVREGAAREREFAIQELRLILSK